MSKAKNPNKLSGNQYKKAMVRKTPAWKQLRVDINDKYDGKDALTLKKLLLGWNVHHLDSNVDRYDDLTIEKFRPLNKSSHELVHTIYRYYRKDKEVLNRLRDILEEMLKYDDEINK